MGIHNDRLANRVAVGLDSFAATHQAFALRQPVEPWLNVKTKGPLGFIVRVGEVPVRIRPLWARPSASGKQLTIDGVTIYVSDIDQDYFELSMIPRANGWGARLRLMSDPGRETESWEIEVETLTYEQACEPSRLPGLEAGPTDRLAGDPASPPPAEYKLKKGSRSKRGGSSGE